MYYSVKRLRVSFLQCASHFFQPYRGADARLSPVEGWPVVPRGIEPRTTRESTELSCRRMEKLPTENQRWKYAGRRWGGLLQCQHSIRLLKVMRSCLLACLQTPTPRGLKGPEEAPQRMAQWRLRHSACCGASQAHPDGDPAACGCLDLAWRLLQYNQNE